MNGHSFNKSLLLGVILAVILSGSQAQGQDRVYTWPASSLMKVLNLQALEFESLQRMNELDSPLVLPGVKSLQGLINQARNEPWVEESSFSRDVDALAARSEKIESGMMDPGLTRDHLRQALGIISDFHKLLADQGYQEKYRYYFIMFGLRFLKLELAGLDDSLETIPVDVLKPALELLDYFRQGEKLDSNVAVLFADQIKEVETIIGQIETNSRSAGVFARLTQLALQYETEISRAAPPIDRWYPRDHFQLLSREVDRLNASFKVFRVRKNVYAPIYSQIHQLTLDLIADDFSTPAQETKLKDLMTRYDRSLDALPVRDTEDQQYVKEITFYMYSISKVMFEGN